MSEHKAKYGARETLDRAVSERDFQQQIIELLKLKHIPFYHTYDSRRSNEGWPDLFFVIDNKAYAWEVKTEKGKQTMEQGLWLLTLSAAGINTRLIRPSDWDYVERTLKEA